MGKKTLIMKNLFTLLLIFYSLNSFSQNELPRPKVLMEFGPSLGSYKGDLSPNYRKVNGGVNFGFIFNNKKRWNIRFDLSYMYLQGQKFLGPDYLEPLNPPYPNNFFQSHTLNTSLSFMFNIINSKHFRLYVAQGIGAFYFNPMDEDGNELIENFEKTRNPNEVYSNFALSLPTRLGITLFL